MLAHIIKERAHIMFSQRIINVLKKKDEKSSVDMMLGRRSRCYFKKNLGKTTVYVWLFQQDQRQRLL